jgi:methyltransferase (TIGR00027 family)
MCAADERHSPGHACRSRINVGGNGQQSQNDRDGAHSDMSLTGAKANVARTAHLTAWSRALGRLIAGDLANGDDLAARALLPYQRTLNRVPRLARSLLEHGLPGALGYFNARTQYFDEVLLQEARAGLDQVVVFGAGFDSRSLRFSDALQGVRVFEVDMPEVLALRAQLLLNGQPAPHSGIAVPIDFEHEDLQHALNGRGYVSQGRTLFLWEGVSYYLPEDAVKAILRLVASHSGAASSILFDYVTRAFVDGDYSGYGSRRLADGWRRLGNVNRFGVDDIAAFMRPLGLTARSDVDANELETRFLSAWPEPQPRTWGCMRIAHAQRTSSSTSA